MSKPIGDESLLFYMICHVYPQDVKQPDSFTPVTGGQVLRWRIAILISAAIAISYLDRQALPVAVKAIEKDIPRVGRFQPGDKPQYGRLARAGRANNDEMLAAADVE